MTKTVGNSIRFCIAQVNPVLGDMDGNGALVIETVHAARMRGAQAVVFPELVLTGYIPEDLLFRSAFMKDVERARRRVSEELKNSDLWVLLGYPRVQEGGLVNTLGVLHGGEWIAEYNKQCLPNDQLFDEKRYFIAGTEPVVCEIAGVATGLCVCEDIWHPKPCRALVDAGAQLILSVSVSPFARDKHDERLHQVQERTRETMRPVIYVAAVGGQDELVFDGGSFVMDKDGELKVAADRFRTGLYDVVVQPATPTVGVSVDAGYMAPGMDRVEAVYRALLLGLADYVRKNDFDKVLLGLSGGIDSALSMAIAVDALGADSVLAVQLPSAYTSEMSLSDSAEQSRIMGVRYLNIGIDPLRAAVEDALSAEFAGTSVDITEENIQARCRAILLMALSNKYGGLLLSTGNKSELAMGYATLYGDMAGGFNVIKDVLKTWVYKLARYRNTSGVVIPERVIERAPSAELRPEQKDSDSLPSYEILDEIIERYVERNEDLDTIIAGGLDADTVRMVIRRLQENEYKRQQAPIGARISSCSFSRRDRRYPVSCSWKEGSGG